jgi:deoxyribodipyrimidine photolyase-related protein
MSTSIFLLFPHQLFEDISLLSSVDEVVLVEEWLFFHQYKFHKQKLVLHRASMKYYEQYLLDNGLKVRYISALEAECDIRKLIRELSQNGVEQIHVYDVCDNWLEQRITKTCHVHSITIKEYPTHLFINTKEDLEMYFGSKKRYFHTDFYIQQRKKLSILVDENGTPEGGKWSYDAENRKKYPKGKIPPIVTNPIKTSYHQEAIEYVEQHFPNNYGVITTHIVYPTTHQQSQQWLEQFLETRFSEFGEYEDAMVDSEHFLHHSVLTPMLNIGLLLPMQIVNAALNYAKENQISLNSLEGFIRQVIGWREFIRGVYVYKGSIERTKNFWNFHKELPSSFYDGTTGLPPIDITIKKLLTTAYNHHIERLMILGNAMVLLEIHPDAVYQWFMEMYIDAYDWVMVPNVYGMSQFADGGLMATKPYISGSSYILKMSNFAKGDWCEQWDALFWHFMNKHRSFFLSNPRLGMLIKTYDKMSEEKKEQIKKLSESGLSRFED